MRRMSFQLTLAAALLGLFTLSSCQKQIADNSTETQQAEETFITTEADAEADVTFGDVADQSTGIDGEIGIGQIDLFAGSNNVDPGEGNEGGDIVTDPLPVRCFSITITPLDPLVFPKTVTIDYGDGCLGRDGKLRKGKVITVYSKPLRIPGAQAVTEFNNYYVDSVKVEGRLVVKNNSTSSVLIITRLVQNGKLTKPNGNYIKWDAEHTHTQVAGLGTPLYPRDDEWTITGGARGEILHGTTLNTWIRVILEPLHKAFTCRWFDKGIVKITRNDKVATLNYGSGTCDNLATITVNGQTREIKLH